MLSSTESTLTSVYNAVLGVNGVSFVSSREIWSGITPRDAVKSIKQSIIVNVVMLGRTLVGCVRPNNVNLGERKMGLVPDDDYLKKIQIFGKCYGY